MDFQYAPQIYSPNMTYYQQGDMFYTMDGYKALSSQYYHPHQQAFIQPFHQVQPTVPTLRLTPPTPIKCKEYSQHSPSVSVPATTIPDESECAVCTRSPAGILCRACGHNFSGRVRKTCPTHPGTVHLMDVDRCPECKAFVLKEFSATTQS